MRIVHQENFFYANSFFRLVPVVTNKHIAIDSTSPFNLSFVFILSKTAQIECTDFVIGEKKYSSLDTIPLKVTLDSSGH